MKKVVVIDDDPTNMGLIQMLLELDGYDVLACATIQEALAQSEEDIAAFVVDCHLARGESGLDLVDIVRSGGTAAPEQTVIIVTSGDQRLEEDSISRGANMFLLKPYPPSKLSKSLNLLMEDEQDGE
jgi:CheY-like chemotaxis protein